MVNLLIGIAIGWVLRSVVLTFQQVNSRRATKKRIEEGIVKFVNKP